MRIVSYNIQYGTGRDGRVDLDRIAETISGADVIALQEVERYFERSGNVDQVAALAELLKGYYWVDGAGVNLAADCLDGADVINRRRTFGNMILSRFPIVSSRNHLLPKYGSVSAPISIQRCALEALIEHPGGRTRFYSVHLSHVTSEERIEQTRALSAIHARAVYEGFAIEGKVDELGLDSDVPAQYVPREAILLGDFNAEPDSPEYDVVAGPLSPYGGRVVNPDGFVDAWDVAGTPKNDGATCEDDGRPIRIDYAFVSTSLRERIRQCYVDQHAAGSDHQPLWLEIDLETSADGQAA